MYRAILNEPPHQLIYPSSLKCDNKINHLLRIRSIPIDIPFETHVAEALDGALKLIQRIAYRGREKSWPAVIKNGDISSNYDSKRESTYASYRNLQVAITTVISLYLGGAFCPMKRTLYLKDTLVQTKTVSTTQPLVCEPG